MTPQQAEAGGSLVVPLSGGQRPGLTRETEMPTEQSQASRPFPPPWTQVPGTGRPGLKGKAGALRPCFQASPLPRTRQGSGTELGPAGLPQGESLIHPTIISRLPAVCQALSQKSRIQRRAGQSRPGGFTQYAKTQQQSAEYWVYRSTEEVGWGKSATDVQTYFPSGSVESCWGVPDTTRKSQAAPHSQAVPHSGI